MLEKKIIIEKIVREPFLKDENIYSYCNTVNLSDRLLKLIDIDTLSKF